MTKIDTTFYFQATSVMKGATGIFQAYGPEERLRRAIDGALGTRKEAKPRNFLQHNELRYGWLWSERAGRLDEVMLAKPRSGMRVLMTHGGAGVAEAINGFFTEHGFSSLEKTQERGQIILDDPLFDPLLAGCITETQVAAVLAERMDAMEAGREPCLPASLLAMHRLLVAGPPNAGKSSLINQLSGFERAFVHAEAGATRDVVEELVDLGGYAVLVGDLPGYSRELRGVDALAWKRAEDQLRLAEAVLFVVDGSTPWKGGAEAAAGTIAASLPDGARVVVVLNKSDLSQKVEGTPWESSFPDAPVVAICSLPDGNARERIEDMAEWLFDA